jgi:ankyrin repeat protein
MHRFFLNSCSDTALNLAVHRQKYQIVDLLLQYRANPNVYNQYGKTALHRAVVSYTNERNNHIRVLLNVSLFNS